MDTFDTLSNNVRMIQETATPKLGEWGWEGHWILVLKPGTKLWECIEENVFDVPELFSFELLNLLAAQKQVLMVEIDNQLSIVTRQFETTEFDII
jgi:hypothetical protein